MNYSLNCVYKKYDIFESGWIPKLCCFWLGFEHQTHKYSSKFCYIQVKKIGKNSNFLGIDQKMNNSGTCSPLLRLWTLKIKRGTRFWDHFMVKRRVRILSGKACSLLRLQNLSSANYDQKWSRKWVPRVQICGSKPIVFWQNNWLLEIKYFFANKCGY